MLNRILSFQTLLMILALAFPASADPPAAWSERMQVFRDWRLDCRADPCTRYVSVARRRRGARCCGSRCRPAPRRP